MLKVGVGEEGGGFLDGQWMLDAGMCRASMITTTSACLNKKFAHTNGDFVHANFGGVTNGRDTTIEVLSMIVTNASDVHTAKEDWSATISTCGL